MIKGSEIRWKDVPHDTDLRTELRIQAKTDLIFLAHDVLGYGDINREDHGEVADFFVHKNPFVPFKDQESEHKLRMLILPRRTFKTTFNIVDTVQWVTVDTEIAIMVMTASNSDDSPLANAFVAEVASHFFQPKGTEPTRFHKLFPEHVITFPIKAGSFFTPARKRFRRDPTVKGVSIEQSLSGWHPDIIKSEDVQDNRNSQTAAALFKVRKNFYVNLKMLPAWGFVDLTATRYGPNDLYAHMLQNRGPRTKLLWKPAYDRKPEVPAELDDDELTIDDVVLNFPKQLPWDFLRECKGEDPESFWTQYMNVAEGNFVPTFKKETLEKRVTPEGELPYHGEVKIAWRFEHDKCRNTAAAAGLLWRGRVTVVEVIRGSFKPTTLAKKLVALAQKWETHLIEIEETPGARDNEDEIRNQALEQRWPVSIQWTEFVRDEGVRNTRIKAMEPHLEAGRLLFADNLQNVREVHRQMYQFGIVEDFEIPIVISRLTASLPSTVASEEFQDDAENAWEALLKQNAYDRIYGADTAPAVAEDQVEEEAEYTPQANAYGLEEIMPGLSG